MLNKFNTRPIFSGCNHFILNSLNFVQNIHEIIERNSRSFRDCQYIFSGYNIFIFVFYSLANILLIPNVLFLFCFNGFYVLLFTYK